MASTVASASYWSNKCSKTNKFKMNNHCISGDAMFITTAVNYFLKRHKFLKLVEPFVLLSQNKYFLSSCLT